MFFRNLTLFRLAPAAIPDPEALERALEDHRLRPCGPLEMATHGFVPPAGNEDEDPLVRHIGDCLSLRIGSEDKILPGAVVNQELSRKVRQLASEEGRPVGGRERRRIKAEILDQLLPRAFSRPSSIAAWLDTRGGWLVLDTASRKAAETALGTLRNALGSLPAIPLAPEKSPRQLMTDWLSTGKLPAGLGLADECELREPTGTGGAIVRCRHQDLESAEVGEHLRNGKQVYQLGLDFEGRIGFVLGEDLVIRKLRFFDVVTEELEQDTPESAGAEWDAVLALMGGEVGQLLGQLQTWFQLPPPEAA